MTLIDDLIQGLPKDQPVRQVLVGVHWTVVCSKWCGMASTITGDNPHAHEKVRSVGQLHELSAHELASFARSDNPLEASLGVAAINSLLDVDETKAVELNAADLLIQRGADKDIALVGHFPFIPRLKEIARNLSVIEQRPAQGEFPAEAAVDLIPNADSVAITGSALINHTLGALLALCRPGALVVVLGPSTPLSPVLINHGAKLISGTRVIDEAAVLRTVSQGATFQQVEGVRLLTMVYDGWYG